MNGRTIVASARVPQAVSEPRPGLQIPELGRNPCRHSRSRAATGPSEASPPPGPRLARSCARHSPYASAAVDPDLSGEPLRGGAGKVGPCSFASSGATGSPTRVVGVSASGVSSTAAKSRRTPLSAPSSHNGEPKRIAPARWRVPLGTLLQASSFGIPHVFVGPVPEGLESVLAAARMDDRNVVSASTQGPPHLVQRRSAGLPRRQHHRREYAKHSRGARRRPAGRSRRDYRV
jgi:hypothetical protein